MKLPQLSLPWAILASVIIAVLGALLALHVVSWPVLAGFIGGVLVPALRSSEGDKAPAVPPLPMLFFGVLFTCIFGFIVAACSTNEAAKWPTTTKAIAGATLDYAECLQTNLSSLAQQGATAFSKDAAIGAAETCGIASIPDGFAILVAVFKDVTARFHNPAPVTPQTAEP